jgi:hypothetical protein
MFFLRGVFVLTGMTMAFQVITWVVVSEINRVIEGSMLQFVNDGLGLGRPLLA